MKKITAKRRGKAFEVVKNAGSCVGIRIRAASCESPHSAKDVMIKVGGVVARGTIHALTVARRFGDRSVARYTPTMLTKRRVRESRLHFFVRIIRHRPPELFTVPTSTILRYWGEDSGKRKQVYIPLEREAPTIYGYKRIPKIPWWLYEGRGGLERIKKRVARH